MISFHNTLSGKKESFKPLQEGKVKIYSCGPTVYDFAHIGNFRTFAFNDLVVRVFRYAGYEVERVQNITDVGHLTSDSDEGEDKILKKARLEKKDPFAIARFFEDAFLEDEAALRITPPDHRPRATEYIQQQIDHTQKLIENGYAYEANGSVYFRTKEFEKYGELSKNNLDDLMAGARIEVNEEKEHPYDFALWKAAEPNHLMQWDSPWGRGFPGWHLECSVMGLSLLGDHFDIHTGGEDLIFPHHECEIAQNEALTGKTSINYWMHVKHLLVDGKKMSKSEGNFFTLRDLFDKGYSGTEIRYLLLSAQYRTSLNFTFEGLDMAKSSIERLVEARRVFTDQAEGNTAETSSVADQAREKYRTALFDDFNAADALGATFELIKCGMKLRDENKLDPETAASIVAFLEHDFEPVFDVFPEGPTLSEQEVTEIEAYIAQRNEARKDENWEEADRLRNLLAEKGVELFDEGDKTNWKLKG